MGEHDCGGILGALRVLEDHWGPVGRDLAACRYTWDDVCTDVLPLDQFVQFVVYAPPGTAVFHVVNEGWTADTHQLTSLIEVAQVLLWSKTKDALEKHPRNFPEPLYRPGSKAQQVSNEPAFTVEDYLRLTGSTDGT